MYNIPLNLSNAMAVLLDTNNNGTPRSGVLNGSTALENIFRNGSVRGDIGPDVASILEETRIAMLCVAHLLTDDNGRESPVVPVLIRSKPT